MLGVFDIKYLPCSAGKGQVLADFVAEFTKDFMEDKEFVSSTLVVSVSSLVAWEVYMDGAANQKGSRVGIVLVSPKKLVLESPCGWPSRPQIMKLNMKLYWPGWQWLPGLGGKLCKSTQIQDWWSNRLMVSLRPESHKCKSILIWLGISNLVLTISP